MDELRHAVPSILKGFTNRAMPQICAKRSLRFFRDRFDLLD